MASGLPEDGTGREKQRENQVTTKPTPPLINILHLVEGGARKRHYKGEQMPLEVHPSLLRLDSHLLCTGVIEGRTDVLSVN